MTNLENSKIGHSGNSEQNAERTAYALRSIAADLVGASGADIERLLREARQQARRQRRKLTYSDIQDVISQTRSPLAPETLWRRSVHEAGHVIARLKLGVGDVELATVNGAGGRSYVESSFGLDEMQTEQGLGNLLTVIMAGRAAEQMVFNIPSLGSAGSDESDLARATEIAKDLETRLGCSGLWPLAYRNESDMRFYDPGLPGRIHQRLEIAFENAISLLDDNRPLLMTLADHLKRSITIDGPTLRKILGLPPAGKEGSRVPTGTEFLRVSGGSESNACGPQNDYFGTSRELSEPSGNFHPSHEKKNLRWRTPIS